MVLGILSIGMLVVVPSLDSADPYKLELAAKEFASAIRYARTESLRLENPHGVDLDTVQPSIRLFRASPGTNPPIPIYDVRHPITKQVYRLDPDALPGIAGVAVSSSPSWSAACTTPGLLGFDSDGRPRCGNPWATTLLTATVTLTYRSHTRNIVVDGETGRVTVQ